MSDGHSSPGEIQATVFALVDESISRRLGAWRFFDASFDRRELEGFHRIADRIMESRQYLASIRHYGYVLPDIETFNRDLAPGLISEGLDQDTQTIVGTLLYLREAGGGRHGWDILLPAEFYHAIARKDTSGLLEFRATDEQVLAGILLFRGGIVEMNAGEGKTIAAVFPAVLHSVLGESVHVITANDYLASRDSSLLAIVYRSLGVSVDAVLSHMIDDERREAYAQQVTYGTMREFGFDFLRDNLKMSPTEQVQRSLEVAIIDEADHALIDEARTPMIIASNPVVTNRAYARIKNSITKLISLQHGLVQGLTTQLSQTDPTSKEFLQLLAKLLLANPENESLCRKISEQKGAYRRIQSLIYQDGIDYPGGTLTGELFFTADPEQRFVTLTDRGQEFLEKHLGAFFDAQDLDQEIGLVRSNPALSWAEGRRLISHLSRQQALRYNIGNQVYQMLRACLLLKKDIDYLVSEGSVVLIDRYTGRPRPDSRYQEGLQQAIEAKEGITVNHDGEVQAQISVQGFASQYRRIAGMTGTAAGAADEFRQKYALDVTVVPTTRPLLRQNFHCRVYSTQHEKLTAIVEEVVFCQRVGRPVLVGTLTIEQSAEISRLLTQQGVVHRLLNAVNCHEEAEIVREAGAFGSVTVATNMAGRGTDIILDPDLNLRITDKYLGLVNHLLAEDVSQVALRCYTKEEADLLWAEISHRNSYSVRRESRSDWEELVVTSQALFAGGLKKASSPSLCLDFGLGLYVIGTELNESPRIDLQLKGRSGRQGEFGWSRQFLSLEDRLLAWHGEAVLGSSCARKADPYGRVYFEGRDVDRSLERLQRNVDREGEVQSSLLQDYVGVIDSLTDNYYRLRRGVMGSENLFDTCARFAKEKANHAVEKYFSRLSFDDYGPQFSCLAKELEEDYGVDCSELWGLGLDLLSDELGRLLVDRLNLAACQLGGKRFEDLARLLLLQTGDELWHDHLRELHELMLNTQLNDYGHKAAVADYVIHSSQAWQAFQLRVSDLFLSRLLTFPLSDAGDSQTEPAAGVTLVEDAAMVLA